MAYTVLARRYRPRTFDEVIGQGPVALTLRRAIEKGRVAHAYLFCGTRGIGKTTVARVLASALNCEKGPTAEPCGKCDLCRAIHRGDDLDVLEIDGASKTSVEDVRQLRENAYYRPARARYKIYYIDEVHMLSRSAFNALLKVLEEPPEHVLFLFSTTEPERLPATILSRCQRFDFRAVPSETIADHLKAICKKEKVKAEAAALVALAREGRGSVRDALTLLDQAIAVSGGEVTLEAVRQTVGAVSGERVLAVVGACAAGDVGRALGLFGDLLAAGADLGALLEQMLRLLRDLLVVKTCGPEAELLDAFGPDRSALAAVAEKLSVPALTASLGYLAEARSRVRYAADGRPIAELALVRTAGLAEMKPLPEVLGRLEALAAALEGGEAAGPAEKKNGAARQTDRPGVSAAAGPRAEGPSRPIPASAAALGVEAAKAAPADAPAAEAEDEAPVAAEAPPEESAATGPPPRPPDVEPPPEARPRRRGSLDDALKDPLVRRAVDLFDGRIVRADE